MSSQWFYGVPLWAVALGLFAILGGATFFSQRAGGRRRAAYAESARGQITAIQGALLGMLALLLGFTFSMAVARFDARRLHQIHEVNAIGTAWLRSQLLPQAARQRCTALFRSYVDNRLSFFEAKDDMDQLRAAQVGTAELHAGLWEEARKASAQEPPSPPVAVSFMQSVNELIDAHASRLEAMRNHVPEPILVLLAAIAASALGMSGFSAGLADLRHPAAPLLAALLTSLLIVTIMDLDRPCGAIGIGSTCMVELKAKLAAEGK